ncbi:MAG: 20S proteasome maturation factor [Claussenomyces sp. TS43310]|nr:MAG: 20S proteasome maturation factor [Claussenomyces sp. TS43310]
MSLRLVPAASHPIRTTPTNTSAPSAPGLHDTLRHGIGPTTTASSSSSSTSAPLDSAHPLEARLAQWSATQDALKLEGLRRTFGMAEPIRRGMELRTVREGEWRPLALGAAAAARPGLHEDILTGRDATCAWEDIFVGDELRASLGVQEEMERKVRMA